MKATVLESLLNKAAGLQVCNFIKSRLQHRCFPVIIAKFLRITILKNPCERHSLKSRPETRDPETQDRDPWLWEPGTRYPDTQDSGNGSLELRTCYPETQNPESKTLRIELMTQIPGIPTCTIDCTNCRPSLFSRKMK